MVAARVAAGARAAADWARVRLLSDYGFAARALVLFILSECQSWCTR